MRSSKIWISVIYISTIISGCQPHSSAQISELSSLTEKISYTLIKKEKTTEGETNEYGYAFLDMKSRKEYAVYEEGLIINRLSILDSNRLMIVRNDPAGAVRTLNKYGMNQNVSLYIYNIKTNTYTPYFKSVQGESPFCRDVCILNDDSLLFCDFKEIYLNIIKTAEMNLVNRITEEGERINRLTAINGLYAVKYSIIKNNELSNKLLIRNIINNDTLLLYSYKGFMAGMSNFSPDSKKIGIIDEGLLIYDMANRKMEKVEMNSAGYSSFHVNEIYFTSNDEFYLIGSFKEESKNCYDIFKYNMINKKLVRISYSKTQKTGLDCSRLRRIN